MQHALQHTADELVLQMAEICGNPNPCSSNPPSQPCPKSVTQCVTGSWIAHRGLPVALFGFGFGGILAFEIARALEASMRKEVKKHALEWPLDYSPLAKVAQLL